MVRDLKRQSTEVLMNSILYLVYLSSIDGIYPWNNAHMIVHQQFIVAHVLPFCVICVHLIIVTRKLRMYNRVVAWSVSIARFENEQNYGVRSKMCCCCCVVTITSIAGSFQEMSIKIFDDAHKKRASKFNCSNINWTLT